MIHTDNLQEGLKIFAIGFSAVFVVLAVLIGVIKCTGVFSLFMSKAEEQKKEETVN